MQCSYTVSIKNNSVAGNYTSIDLFGASGSVSGNNVGGGSEGVSVYGSGTGTVFGNTVTARQLGIAVGVAVAVSSNTVINAAYGIYVDTGAAGSSLTSNHVFNNQQIRHLRVDRRGIHQEQCHQQRLGRNRIQLPHG